MKRYYLCLMMMLGLLIRPDETLLAQGNSVYYLNLYRQDRILELEKLYNSERKMPHEWRRFIRILFKKDAEAAIKEMGTLYPQAKDTSLKSLIKERIAKYYLAKGYYGISKRILEKDPAFFFRLISVHHESASDSISQTGKSDRKIFFGIQIGAYSEKRNAIRMKRQYENRYPNTKVLKKNKSGQVLYLVVVGGYRSRDKAKNVEKEVRDKFQVKGYIIQYYGVVHGN